MRLIRFSIDRRIKYGLLEDERITVIKGSPFPVGRDGHSRLALTSEVHRLESVKVLAPCLPSKIVCLGLNYHTHAAEFNLNIPRVPLIFIKPSTSVIGPEDRIILPGGYTRVDYEGELAVVIGRRTKNVAAQNVFEHILGYTCFNDVSERHDQKEDGQWTRAKSYDTFAPVGPWIETELDPDDVLLQTRLNGELRQSGRTSDMIFTVAEQVSFISSIMTLLPGDVIATGTTSGVGNMNPGDVVEVTIEKIGTLKNTVGKS